MSRRKKFPNPNPNLAQVEWPVHENYVFKNTSRRVWKETKFVDISQAIVEASGKIKFKYPLNLDYLHKEFSIEYSKIDDRSSILEWCKAVGLPICGSFAYVDEIIGSAAYINWLMIMITAVQKHDYNQLVELVRMKETTDELLVIFEPKNLSNYQGIYGTNFHRYHEQNSIEESFISPYCYGYRPIELSYSPRQVTETKQSYGNKQWLIFAAQAYLKFAFERLLTGILPTLDWRVDISGQPGLSSTLLLPSPWQAICLTLFQEVAGTSTLAKCRRPDCGTFFFRKRNDHDYCPKSSCRKWCDSHGYTKVRGPRTR